MRRTSSGIEWEEFWSLWRRTNCQPEWSRAVGFLELDDKLLIDPVLHTFLEGCSIRELEQFLTGAPLSLVKIYLHRLPKENARRVIQGFRIEDVDTLRQAYYHPPKLGIGAGA